MKKLKQVQKPSLKQKKKPLKIQKNNASNKLRKLQTKPKKKSNIGIKKDNPFSLKRTDKMVNSSKNTKKQKSKKQNTNTTHPSKAVFMAAVITGITLAGIVILLFIGIRSYREKKLIDTTVMHLKEVDPQAFVAANNGYVFFVKDKSVMLKNIDGEVIWEIPILADEFEIIHEEPNLLIMYNVDNDIIIERYNNSGEMESILIEDKIIDIKINSIGEVVVLTEQVGNTYSLKIYNSHGELKKELLEFSAEEFGFPTGISISPNGTKVAISVVDTTSPVVISNVSIIDVESGKTIEGNSFKDAVAYDVTFSSERNWEILKS